MTPRPLRNIFYPSDFKPGDEFAFAHALKLAVAARAELHILHANPDTEDIDWEDFPSVRRTLQQWGMIRPGASKEEVHQLGLDVHKVKRSNPDPVEAILHYLEDHETDMVVLSTHQRRGLSRWMNPSVAEPIARKSGLSTLFVPRRVVGFVSHENGSLHLNTVLVPIDRVPDPQAAVNVLVSLGRVLGCAALRVAFLHVGPAEEAPTIDLDLPAGWATDRLSGEGDVVNEILRQAEEIDADLIAMATQGRDGFLDALRGSTTEQVLRAAKCPVLAVPATE